MGEEACDEFELHAVDGDMKRTLVVRGGYSRDEVYLGICRNAESQPDEIIAVDGRELKRVLRSMVIGEPRKRRRKSL
jgi:hypothetical protein